VAIHVVPIVGRATELRILEDAHTRASTGRVQCVLVEGEAGTGKTTVLNAFAESISQSKPLWLAGDPAESSLPYGVVVQVINGIANGSPPVDIDFYAGQDPFTVGADLIRIVSRRRGSHPLVVVLDDAHLVDPQSAAALTFAVRRVLADPVLLVLGVRSDPVTEHWQGLRRLAKTHGQCLVLTGFSVPEIGELARATGFGALSITGAKRLHAHTGGNPLAVTAAMSQLRVEQV
jgi:predicted ATPase